jgi:hypothetical protein
MEPELLVPQEVDRIFRTRPGWAEKQAIAGNLPHITLPDGQVRFVRSQIDRLIRPALVGARGEPGEN